MSEQIVGTVVGLSTKPLTIKNGPRAGQSTLKHYVAVANGNGETTVVGCGFKQPYAVGQAVSIPVEYKYGEWQIVKVQAAPTGPQPAATAFPPQAGQPPAPAPTPFFPSSTPRKGSGVFPIPKESGENSIIRQNALTNARELVSAVYGLPHASFAGSTKDARRQHLDEVADDVLYVAYKFAEFSSGQREVRISKDRAKLAPPSAVSDTAASVAAGE